VIVADPALEPVTIVITRGAVVMPCNTKKVDGDAIATEGLLLVSVTNTPPAGAAVPSVTGKFTELPDSTVTFAGSSIPAGVGCGTVTLAVALAMFAALAVIVTDPAAMPVTGTAALVAPVAKLTVAGVAATNALLELKLTAIAAGAGADKFSVRFCVVDSPTVKLPGQKLIVVAVVDPPVT